MLKSLLVQKLLSKMAYNVSGIPLEPKLRLTSWKLLVIPRVMTSGIVRTFGIGQSAGKSPKNRFGKVYGGPSTTRTVIGGQ